MRRTGNISLVADPY